VSDLKFVYPANPAVFELVKTNHKRHMALDKIKGPKGSCKWCLIKIDNNRKKYCSKDCKASAWAFFYPQKYAYPFLSERQGGKCAHCSYLFIERTKKVKRNESYLIGWDKETGKSIRKDDICYYDDMGDVDHIIPIHQGGEILGLENIQLLCRGCHIKKSAKERRKNVILEKTDASDNETLPDAQVLAQESTQGSQGPL